MTTPKYIHVPTDAATQPRGRRCLVNKYWMNRPDKGLAFYVLPGTTRHSLSLDDRLRPQCNDNEEITKRLLKDGYECVKVHCVFEAHAIFEARKVLP
jgi:hypothetical protein